jgi:hypothetical protein
MAFDLAMHCINTRDDSLFGISTGREKNKDVPEMEGRNVLAFKGPTTEGTFDYTMTHRRTYLPDRCVPAIALFAAKLDDYRHDYSVTGCTACKLLVDGHQEMLRAMGGEWCSQNLPRAHPWFLQP